MVLGALGVVEDDHAAWAQEFKTFAQAEAAGAAVDEDKVEVDAQGFGIGDIGREHREIDFGGRVPGFDLFLGGRRDV